MNSQSIAVRSFTAVLSCLAVAACTLAYAASRTPINVPPEICDLVVVADHETGDVRVSWSGGTPPFIVVRSDTEDLRLATRLDVVAPAARVSEFVDPRAFLARRRLFYQVYDRNSLPDIFGFSPEGWRSGGRDNGTWGRVPLRLQQDHRSSGWCRSPR